MKIKTIIFLLSALLSGCSIIPGLQSSPTIIPIETTAPTESITLAKTISPILLITPTQDISTKYLEFLHAQPEGYTWKVMPEKLLAVAIPDDWYFKDDGINGVYVTRENIDQLDSFYAGMAVYIFDEFEQNMTADAYAQLLIQAQASVNTTQEIIDRSVYEREDATLYQLRIRAEFPDDIETNQDKTIQYMATTIADRVLFIIFETPTSEWEDVFSKYGEMGRYVVVFSD